MRQPYAVVALAVLAAATSPARALGLGEPRTQAVLGQPVDLRLPITGDGADALQPGCVTVVVQSGDNRLNKDQVRTALERASPTSNDTVLHLRTTVAIEEPVVQIDVTIGCQGRMSRQYTLLPDPPRFEAPASLPQVVAAAPSAVADAPVTTTELPPTPVPRRAALPATPRAASAPAERVRAPRPSRPPRPVHRELIAAAPAAEPAASAASRAPAPRVARAAQPLASAASAATRRGPRLSLETPTVAVNTPAAPVAKGAAPVARAASATTPIAPATAASATPGKPAAAASAPVATATPSADALLATSAPSAGPADATGQMAESLARLQAETRAQRATLARLEAQLAQQNNSPWGAAGPALAGLSALLVLVAGGLGWRLHTQRRRYEQGWWDSEAKEPNRTRF
jgi:hypothetical protein